tara:strand:+ start:115 stop:255 length:141 start_codon:yes stop_codon:yes gene_type:complete
LKSKVHNDLKFPYKITLSDNYNKKYVIRNEKDEESKLKRYYPELFK